MWILSYFIEWNSCMCKYLFKVHALNSSILYAIYIYIYISCRISIPSSPSNIIELPIPAIVKIDLFLQVLFYEGHSKQ